MKKYLFTLLLSGIFMMVGSSLFAQEDEFDLTNDIDAGSLIQAGLGYTNIGGDNFISFRLQPELSLGKLAFGLDVPLMFDLTNKKLRTEEFQGGVGVLRMIRYVSWGVKKRDPVYIRVGDITGSYLGFGMLVNNYSNATSFDKRKVGVTYDVLVKNMVGVEGIYGDFDFSSFNFFGIRPYIRPLGATRIPILRTLEVGFTYVSDQDQTKIITDTETVQNNTFLTQSGTTAYAGDIGVQLMNNRFTHITLYAQYGNLPKVESDLLALALENQAAAIEAAEPLSGAPAMMRAYDGGSGFGYGLDFKFKILGDVLRADARVERLSYSNYFMPSFFDAAYEMNKNEKIMSISTIEEKKGIYGSLSITALSKIRIGGSLMIPDEVSEASPAFITLDLDASKLIEKVTLTGTYYKGGLTDLSDAIKLDGRSMAQVRAGYKLYPFLIIGMDYRWTWSVLADGTYEASNYISPYFGFSLPLNLGGNGGE